MKNYDLKHISYHVLVGLYFIWLPVFGILLCMALNSILGDGDAGLAKIFVVWISLNLIMGTSLFAVLQLYRNRSLAAKIIWYTYGTIVIVALLTIFFMIKRV